MPKKHEAITFVPTSRRRRTATVAKSDGSCIIIPALRQRREVEARASDGLETVAGLCSQLVRLVEASEHHTWPAARNGGRRL